MSEGTHADPDFGTRQDEVHAPHSADVDLSGSAYLNDGILDSGTHQLVQLAEEHQRGSA